MALGRNDACHCGSGKKYKKCHLDADERARALAPKVPPMVAAPRLVPAAYEPPPPMSTYEPPPYVPSPEEARWERFWEDYDAAELDERIAIARRALAAEPDGEELGELAFELVEKLTQPLQRAGRTADLEALLREIEAQYPSAADRNAEWFHLWRTESALLTGGDALAPMLAWAPRCFKLVEMFFRALDQLSFHGRQSELAAVTAAAWPAITGGDVMESGIDELGDLATLTAVGRRLDESPGLDHLDDALRAEVDRFETIVPAWVDRYIKIDRGLVTDPRSAADLLGDDAEAAIDRLLIEFAAALRTRWSWPRTRAELARRALLTFLLERLDEHDQQVAKPAAAGRVEALVLPSSEVFEKAVSRYFGFLALGSWKGLALFAALPAWTVFLVEQKLASAEAAAARRGSLAKLVPDVVVAAEGVGYDPLVRAEIERAFGPTAP
ncbi:MAG: hypothetical protein JWM10_2346 [Myxococcaceae bacterium]|nr:hypothetical protein [Myxococcaceae bacterium]